MSSSHNSNGTRATLYSDTFGSFGNYLTAFGLGGAAGIASKTILDGFSSVRKLEP